MVLATEATDEQLLHGVLMARTDSDVVLQSIVDSLIERPQIKGLVLLHEDVDELFSIFRSLFKEIDAAGGVVRNDQGAILFIFRNGKWDLPKGKLEKGETIEEGAMREVEEECGVHGLKINGELKPTYHIFERNDQWCFKTTYWFNMNYSGSEVLVPQAEEGIERAEWIAEKDLGKVRENTWSNILVLLDQVT